MPGDLLLPDTAFDICCVVPCVSVWVGAWVGGGVCACCRYAAAVFGDKVLKGLNGEPTFEYAYVQSSLTEASFFASKVRGPTLWLAEALSPEGQQQGCWFSHSLHCGHSSHQHLQCGTGAHAIPSSPMCTPLSRTRRAASGVLQQPRHVGPMCFHALGKQSKAVLWCV